MATIAHESPPVQHARNQLYNATVEQVERITNDLMVLRVRPDNGPRTFEAGQYTLLGLGDWEPRLPDMPEDHGSEAECPADLGHTRLVRRAYSITSPLLDDFGHVALAGEGGVLEFYIALVRDSVVPAELTPRLFMLRQGDRLYVGPRCRGRYTLARITDPRDTIVFLATGCGEAPHNAMIAELLRREHSGQIVSVTCTRYVKDLAYLGKHRLLERAHDNYRYLTLTTREPRNLERGHRHYVGKRYIQDYFASEDLEKDAGVEFDPTNTHVFLCGSPAMIGVPMHTRDESKRYPESIGMIQLLEKRGFTIDRLNDPGQIHFEKYW